MSEQWKIWRHRQGLVMHGDQTGDEYPYPREVRYAIPEEVHADLFAWSRQSANEYPYERAVPIRCVRNVQSDTEDRPEAQWADGGTFPAAKFLELYEPVS